MWWRGYVLGRMQTPSDRHAHTVTSAPTCPYPFSLCPSHLRSLAGTCIDDRPSHILFLKCRSTIYHTLTKRTVDPHLASQTSGNPFLRTPNSTGGSSHPLRLHPYLDNINAAQLGLNLSIISDLYRRRLSHFRLSSPPSLSSSLSPVNRSPLLHGSRSA